MGGDDYIIDDNGAWGNPGQALVWYRDEVKRLRGALSRMISMHEMMMGKINHGSSFYDAECLREMNEAPIQARVALTPNVK